MKMQTRTAARPVAARPPSLRAAALAALLLVAPVPAVLSAAQDDGDERAARTARTFDDLTWRERTDRPVLGFTRGPAGLLLTPSEHAQYAELTDRVERLRFIEGFWASVAGNCPPGENPVRDEFWQRSQRAHEEYHDEGIPGWLTDRGRVMLFAGTPDERAEATASVDGTERPAEIWRWSAPGDGPSSAAFVRETFGWRLVGLDVAGTDGRIEIEAGDVPSLQVATARLASVFRAKGCALTPEQMAQMKDLGWRQALFAATGGLLEGTPADADGSLSPEWLFFPARDGATFTIVSFLLDARPGEGERIVVMLRDEENADASYVLGAGESEFEYRESGGKVVARSARSLPPGRYKLAAGWVSPADEVTIAHAGSQIVARVTDESLRLTSVVLASKLETSDSGEPGPFSVGGYAFTPTLGSTFRAGDTFYMLFQVVGATANASGQADVTVSYALQGKHPQRGWVPIGPPQTETDPGGVRVREVPIPPSYPPTDYKWVVEVKDNATGQSVTREVPFTVVGS